MLNIKINTLLADEHYELIKEKIVQRIKNILGSGECRVDGKKYIITKDAGCENYLKELVIDTEKPKAYPNLRRLIVAKPDELIGIIVATKRKHPALFKRNTINPWSDFNRIIYNIFVKSCYDSDIFNKQNFIESIALETCPYCNRNYTYAVEDGKVKPQIDHFFPKSIYPFLAMSYYNLIPACPICNGLDVKGESDPLVFDVKDNTKVIDQILINPYLVKYDDFRFSYSIKTPNILSKNYIDISLDVPADGYNEIFKLNELYNKHTDHVEELIQKARIKHPLSYQAMMEERFNISFANLPKSLYLRIVLGNYVLEDELHKRPLSKLYRDIALQLGIITKADLTDSHK